MKDLVLTFYAGVEEEVPRVSGQKRTKKDPSDVPKWEKIGKEIQGEIYREKNGGKSLERSLSRGPEKGEAGSNQENGDVRPQGFGRAENQIGGRVKVTSAVKRVENSESSEWRDRERHRAGGKPDRRKCGGHTRGKTRKKLGHKSSERDRERNNKNREEPGIPGER